MTRLRNVVLFAQPVFERGSEMLREVDEQLVPSLCVEGTLRPPQTVPMNEANEVVVGEGTELVCALADGGDVLESE